MPIQTDGIIITNQRIKSIYYLLEIDCPSVADQVIPGQFVMIHIANNDSLLLRRPFSIFRYYPTNALDKKKRGHLVILYKIAGKGTRILTHLKKGDHVNLLGPLGNGFTLPPLPSSKEFILIGGGVGIVSLYSIAEALKGFKLTAFIGGSSKSDILCDKDISNLHSRIFISTDDGSLGFKGTVVDLFLSKHNLFTNNKYIIYACGPIPMLKQLSKYIRTNKYICQASLESRMGCGFGACWGCVVKTKDSKSPYQRVCQDGPVFPLESIIWE